MFYLHGLHMRSLQCTSVSVWTCDINFFVRCEKDFPKNLSELHHLISAKEINYLCC
uniref:Uncharacterized protein n=1 Tax=Anguilla anguilla TaxID=7936 RepID=A0A0E9SJF8_ANGAN